MRRGEIVSGKTWDKHLIVRCLRGEKKRSGCPLIETSLNLCELNQEHSICILLQVIGRYYQSTRVGWISKECVIVWSSPQLAAIIIKQNAKTLLRPKQLFRAHKKKDNSCLHMLSLQNRRVYASQHLESWKKVPMESEKL